jgi:peptidoglycan/LPS O-acetylase OafA/YrhL
MKRDDSPNLDLLRSFAVLTVMIDHLVPTLTARGVAVPGWLATFTTHIGQSGVLAFFVHTSLVLMYSLRRMSRHHQGTALVGRFYVRRAFRIYPLALACIAMVLLLGLPAMTWRPTPPITRNVVLANLLLVQNLWTKQSVLGPLWSLPYEVQMYVVLPFLYFVARKPGGARSIAVMLAATVALGFVADRVTHGHLNMAAYVPCFVAGVLCFALREKLPPLLSAKIWPWFVIGAISLYCVVHIGQPVPVYWIGWIFCLVLALAINLFKDSASPGLNTMANRVATYSYGLYLLHVPVLHLLFNVLDLSPRIAVPIYFVLTYVLSMATYRLLEGPFIKIGRRLSD